MQHEHMRSSPVHMVREALETLPTALQSHATERTGVQSPFARSLRTHFLRIVVLDDPFYNGRDTANAIMARHTDLLAAQPVDSLACPYLMLMVDFDPHGDGVDEPHLYLKELWSLAHKELTAVFRYCYGFAEVKDPAAFARFVTACQIETTMPFNDYWTVTPPLPSLSIGLLFAAPVAAVAVAILAVVLAHWSWWAGLLLALALLAGSLAFDYALLLRRAARPFPAAPDATLRHVLKALYLQQAFTRFAIDQQDADASTLRRAFTAFLDRHRPNDLDGPTQPPGVLRSRFEETSNARA